MKIALFGGTFNPIHYGHLILAETAFSEFKLDKIIFVPSGQPPHKSAGDGSKEHRFNMTKLVVEGNRHFSISDYEIRKKRITYTYDTITYFKKKYPKWQISFLLGIDLLMEIYTWKGGEKVFELCEFFAGLRPNYPAGRLPQKLRDKVTLFRIPLTDISSTDIRRRIKQGRSIRYLVPEPAEKYILKNKLYLWK